MKKPVLIRIAEEIIGHERSGGIEWPVTCFAVRNMRTKAAVKVNTPEEAHKVATRRAAKIGGRVYRGSLPNSWHSALAEFPRS